MEERVPEIRFKGFENVWKQHKLFELGKIKTGSTPSTSIDEYYSNDGIPWVTPTDIIANTISVSSKRLSKKGEEVGRVVPANTILCTCIASIGKNALLTVKGSFNQQINCLIPNEDNDAYFLLSESDLWSSKMKKMAALGTMQIVNKSEFSDIPTNLPDLEEQKEIASYFRYLDKIITLTQQKLDQLKNLKKACLEKMFPKEGETVPEIRFKGFEGPWEKKKLGDALSLLKDGTHGTHQDSEAGPLLLSAKNIKNGKICWDKSDRRISYTEYENIFSTYQLKEGDVLLTIVGSIGETAIFHQTDEIAFQRSVAFLRPKKELASSFLFCEIQNSKFQEELNSRKSTSAQPGIYLGDVADIPIFFPESISEQTVIGELLKNIDGLITLHQQKLDKLKNLKKALLDKMFV